MSKQSNIKTSFADTKVDDMLIEMIAPKVLEIENKFSSGEGLTQDDINTLLLKSQYNHINHLDLKLNAVTDSVIALETKFVALETKFVALETKFVALETKFDAKFVALENKFDAKFATLETKFDLLRKDFDLLKSDIENIVANAINKNMFMLFGVLGAFLVLSKLMDKFL